MRFRSVSYQPSCLSASQFNSQHCLKNRLSLTYFSGNERSHFLFFCYDCQKIFVFTAGSCPYRTTEVRMIFSCSTFVTKLSLQQFLVCFKWVQRKQAGVSAKSNGSVPYFFCFCYVSYHTSASLTYPMVSQLKRCAYKRICRFISSVIIISTIVSCWILLHIR